MLDRWDKKRTFAPAASKKASVHLFSADWLEQKHIDLNIFEFEHWFAREKGRVCWFRRGKKGVLLVKGFFGDGPCVMILRVTIRNCDPDWNKNSAAMRFNSKLMNFTFWTWQENIPLDRWSWSRGRQDSSSWKQDCCQFNRLLLEGEGKSSRWGGNFYSNYNSLSSNNCRWLNRCFKASIDDLIDYWTLELKFYKFVSSKNALFYYNILSPDSWICYVLVEPYYANWQ